MEIEKEILDDLGEILNNLEDDLQLDESGEEGYDNIEESYEAVKNFTLKVLKKKYKKWEKRNG